MDDYGFSFLSTSSGKEEQQEESLLVPFLTGGFTGIFTSAALCPSDVIKCKVRKEEGKSVRMNIQKKEERKELSLNGSLSFRHFLHLFRLLSCCKRGSPGRVSFHPFFSFAIPPFLLLRPVIYFI